MAVLLTVLLAVFTLVLPIALLFWFWRAGVASRAQLGTTVVLFGTALVALAWSVPLAACLGPARLRTPRSNP